MKLFGRDLDSDVAIIAEVGVNHEGDVEAASKLVRLAAEAGADAVKFQSYTPDRFISRADAERFARVGRFALDENSHRRLAAEAAKAGIRFFSTAVTEDWVPLLAELGEAVKIASGDLTFEPVIRAAARSGRPVILSVGLGTVNEIDRAVDWFASEIGAAAIADRLVLMHCVVAYPTPVEEANVMSVPFLRERYRLRVGYSNHVAGAEACYAAVALGAPVIEAHFTDRREGRTFRDHALSFEPAELSDLVQKLRRIRASLGQFGKQRHPSEIGNISAARKGVVAARDLAAGDVIKAGDVIFARPGSEFTSLEIGAVVGARLSQAVARGMLIPRAGIAAKSH